MKNCAFQYATPHKIYEDTDLISKEEAEKLWDEYVPMFKEHLEKGLEPEMAIWVDMENISSYRKTSRHWCADDFIIKDGEMYSVVPVA